MIYKYNFLNNIINHNNKFKILQIKQFSNKQNKYKKSYLMNKILKYNI